MLNILRKKNLFFSKPYIRSLQQSVSTITQRKYGVHTHKYFQLLIKILKPGELLQINPVLRCIGPTQARYIA